MKKDDIATAVELPVWQAPNDDVLLNHIRDDLNIYFKIWTESGVYSNLVGILKFKKVWAVQFERNKKLYYYPNRNDDDNNSCYWVIKDSTWLERLIIDRNTHDPYWRQYDHANYSHYIIQSDKFYIEIIASSIDFSTKPKKIVNKLKLW